jgi:hypothetical protein
LVRQRNLSQQEIKFRILSYLYNKEEGSNAHNIQFHAVTGHTQEAGGFARFQEAGGFARFQEAGLFRNPQHCSGREPKRYSFKNGRLIIDTFLGPIIDSEIHISHRQILRLLKRQSLLLMR